MDMEAAGRAARSRSREKAEAEAAERAKMTSPDRVVDSILRAIRAGAYVPGQRLIEADLTRDYQVSRGPVREALKRLAAEGVLTLTRHRGAYVRALSRSEVNDSLMMLEVLVGLMAKLAAKRISENDNANRMREAFERGLGNRFGFLEPMQFTQREDTTAVAADAVRESFP